MHLASAAVATVGLCLVAGARDAHAFEAPSTASSVASGCMRGASYQNATNPQRYDLLQLNPNTTTYQSGTWKQVPGATGNAITIGASGFPWWIATENGYIYTTRSLTSPTAVAVSTSDFGANELTSIAVSDPNQQYGMWVIYGGAPYVNTGTQNNLNTLRWEPPFFSGGSAVKIAMFDTDEVGQCRPGYLPGQPLGNPISIALPWVLTDIGSLYAYSVSSSQSCYNGSFTQLASPEPAGRIVDVTQNYALTSDGKVWGWNSSNRTWSPASTFSATGLTGIANGADGFFEVNSSHDIFVYYDD